MPPFTPRNPRSLSLPLPKDLSQPLALQYQPKEVESRWYEWWQANGLFEPPREGLRSKAGDIPHEPGETFSLVLPPPNVTGQLHIGHALTVAVQDTLIRFHRMRGFHTLYLPGTDHAGIATQVAVEKYLAVTERKSRHQLGRSTFLERVERWRATQSDHIMTQLRYLGASLDWTRERFTMDMSYSRAVVEAFTRFHQEGILCRATRLVNWCPSLQSVISDLEVEYMEVTPNQTIRVPDYPQPVEMGCMTAFAYLLVGQEGEIVVETTRPETILGDVAVAVHPEDKRYACYRDKKVYLQCPFRRETIPLIFDSFLVDPEFGTGAVKLTPAHDPNDYEAGQRHRLPCLTIFDKQGRISVPGEYYAMHRYDCRKAILLALKSKGLWRSSRPHAMRIGVCSRTRDLIEPRLVPQWFVDCGQMAQRAIEVVRSGELRLFPTYHEATWYRWLNHIKPWCISRQLWWGHRIPAYKAFLDGKPLGDGDEKEKWVVARSVEEAREKAKTRFNLKNIADSQLTLEQDEDVLDTWFSSALWPFAALGWPDTQGRDFKHFFPNDVLETGHDILFFWVARMVMCSLHFLHVIPFREVYLHAMVRDKKGEKMSKSKGNVIDPLDVLHGITLKEMHRKLTQGNLDTKEMERTKLLQQRAFPKGLPECGADALRFGLLTYTASGKSVNLDIERILGYRQFCNKLWNATRFVLYFAWGEGSSIMSPDTLTGEVLPHLPFSCRWILSRLETCVGICNQSLTCGTYDFSALTTAAYHFWLYEFCDVFLELVKPQIRDQALKDEAYTQVLHYCLDHALRLLHPMMPFVTEELWQRLPGHDTQIPRSIMGSAYPQVRGFRDEEVEKEMSLLLRLVHALRSLKAQYGLPPKTRPRAFVLCQGDETRFQGLHTHRSHLLAVLSLCDIQVIDTMDQVPKKGSAMEIVSPNLTVFVIFQGHIDAKIGRARLDKHLQSSRQQLETLLGKMKLEAYTTRVPPQIQKTNRDRVAELESEIQKKQLALNTLEELEEGT